MGNSCSRRAAGAPLGFPRDNRDQSPRGDRHPCLRGATWSRRLRRMHGWTRWTACAAAPCGGVAEEPSEPGFSLHPDLGDILTLHALTHGQNNDMISRSPTSETMIESNLGYENLFGGNSASRCRNPGRPADLRPCPNRSENAIAGELRCPAMLRIADFRSAICRNSRYCTATESLL